MKEKIHFTKMHGAGNDYIYVDTSIYNIKDPAAAARAWSDRHKGIGSDGLVLIGHSPITEADFTMRIFNADGSEAMMCGNASRCIGKYLYEKGLTKQTQIRLLTLSGIKLLNLHIANGIVESVTVDMGEPVFEDDRLFNPGLLNAEKLPSITGGAGGGSLFVSMGNPHYVIFTDDVDAVETMGKELEYHPAFPERANIEFAEMRPDGIRVRVWERGSGITMACGTGACATAVAACKTGRTGRKNRIIMDGGELEIEWREADNHVYMTGPAEFVFEGEIEI
ncbi:MAG: diaminopimelate epimerase [Bacteroidaceae bacterium]|nr:diaminopimelate epimerase [Bacteroidaceae bacterium]